VSNSYVLHKLRLVLFPWRHRPWSRAHAAAAAGAGGAYDAGAPGKSDGYAPPREDVNSPDLYIPGEHTLRRLLPRRRADAAWLPQSWRL